MPEKRSLQERATCQHAPFPPPPPLAAPSQSPGATLAAQGHLPGLQGWPAYSKNTSPAWYVAGDACPLRSAQLPVQSSQRLIIGRSCKIKFKNEPMLLQAIFPSLVPLPHQPKPAPQSLGTPEPSTFAQSKAPTGIQSIPPGRADGPVINTNISNSYHLSSACCVLGR